MKYIVILGDGMADYPCDFEGGKTPLVLANKPTIDSLAKYSEVGLCKTIPDGMKPGSDVANLSVLGYDPKDCYTGRSPLEAVNIGIELTDTDLTARANLVTLSDEADYADKVMVDYSAGEITTEESSELINYLKDKLNNEKYSLYSGISYRHCLVVKNGKFADSITPPHDISGKKIRDYLPTGIVGEEYLEMMKKSYELLKNHPINIKRVKAGKNPANSLWFWGEGTKPKLDNFYEKFGVKAGMISAVDLLQGIAKLAGMQVIKVDGATGNYDTNFTGKATATLDALLGGLDMVYVHMEAPDECGHHGDMEHKVFSIGEISEKVVKPIIEGLNKAGEPFSMLICPDHPTPISIKTHCSDPIPYLIYKSNKKANGTATAYTEEEATKTGIYLDKGNMLMQKLLKD